MSVTAIVVVAEISLTLAHKLTDRTELATYPLNAGAAYLDNPEDYFKVAIFGGSSAAGYNSERGFADIIRFELHSRYPRLKIFIKNYAQPGYPFHRHEAEALKAVIGFYDVFLIYAGHNEALNYLDDVGFFRTGDAKGGPSLRPIKVENSGGLGQSLVRFAKSNSRIYPITRKIREKYLNQLGGAGNVRRRTYQYDRFNEFELEKAVPEDVIASIPVVFDRDLREIAQKAVEQNKQVIISSVPVNETYPPFFSAYRPGITEQEIAEFQANYNRGLERFQRSEFDEALTFFATAGVIDGDVSILNHFIGQAYLAMGDGDTGQEFLRRSVDQDGLPVRSLRILSSVAETIGLENSNVYYVDNVGAFVESIDNGLDHEDLFADFQHPTMLGHIIIADNFLRAMAKLEPMNRLSTGKGTVEFSVADADAILEHYQRALGVTKKDKQQTAYLRARWHLGAADKAAYPEKHLQSAQENALRYYLLSEQTDSENAMSLLLRALVEGKRGNPELAVSMGNQAIQLAPFYVKEVLYGSGGLPTRDYWIYAFNDLGIQYSEKEGFLSPGDKLTQN